MPGLLDDRQLERVFNAWRRAVRLDPVLSRIATPDLHPMCTAFNNALTGDDEGQLGEACDQLVRENLEAQTVTRIATFLAETFADEVGNTSGVVSRSLVSTLGHVCGLMIETMVSDVTQLATRDSLTGLENRRAWDQALISYSEARREIALCMIDLDGLKVINDTHGHAAGDTYLAQFAKDLLNSTPSEGRAYRFAGDEYAMLLPNSSSRELEQVISELHSRTGVAPFSYGIASTAEPFERIQDLTNLADARMYQMKQRRKLAREETAASMETQPESNGAVVPTQTA